MPISLAAYFVTSDNGGRVVTANGLSSPFLYDKKVSLLALEQAIKNGLIDKIEAPIVRQQINNSPLPYEDVLVTPLMESVGMLESIPFAREFAREEYVETRRKPEDLRELHGHPAHQKQRPCRGRQRTTGKR
jgi:hypothetical protein